MDIQLDSEREDIEIGLAVSKLVSSGAWKLIKERTNERAEYLEHTKNNAFHAQTVLACVREINGILLIDEVVRELIDRGNQAAAQSAP